MNIPYQSYGSGPGLVLLHGFPCNGSLWRHVVAPLAELHRVIVPDLPAANFPETAEGLSQLLDREGLASAVFAGHSMGGYLLMEFIARYPEKVKGASMVHSSAKADDEEKKESRRKAIRLMQSSGKEAFLNQAVPKMFAPASLKSRSEEAAWLMELSKSIDTPILTGYYDAMIAREDRTAIISNTRLPFQWIVGREDAAIPPLAQLEQSALPRRSFVSVYEDCGHLSMLENPQKLKSDLLEFTKYCEDSIT